MSMITLDHVSRFYKEVPAVEDLTFQVEKGEIFGLLGPSGAGKTTTIRLLTTLLPVQSGSAQVAGHDVTKAGKQVRANIGYISQTGSSDRTRTGRANLRLIGRLYGLSDAAIKTRTASLATILQITDILDRRVSTYSGGQKRRLDIALGLLHQPTVLFMDEPTTGLDPQNRKDLLQYLKKLAGNGLTILFTTHLMDEADVLADRVSIIDQGKIVALDTPDHLKQSLQGDILTLSIGAHDQTVALPLDDLPDIRNVHQLSAEDFRMEIADSAANVPEVFQRLTTAGLTIHSFSITKPTLNDVFIARTGHAPITSDTQETK